MNQVVFWQNGPSHSQQPAINGLAGLVPGRVTCVWEADISAMRRTLGWRSPDYSAVRQLTLSSPSWRADAKRLIDETAGAVHVFSGVRAYRKLAFALAQVRHQRDTKIAIMAEAGISLGIRGPFRPLFAALQIAPWLDRVVAFLVMGSLGVDFYRKARVPASLLFPFMYQAPDYVRPKEREPTPQVRFFYLGQFHKRKGVDIAIRALGACRDLPGWRFTLCGAGPERESLESLAKDVGIADRCTWHPAHPHDEAMGLLAENDVALVPSRFDGWGVVTNEAIAAGLGAIVSDRCGSRDLIHASGAGIVVKGGSVEDLCGGLRRCILDTGAVAKFRAQARSYAPATRGPQVAQYLFDVLHFVTGQSAQRPCAPWLGSSAHAG